MSTSPSSGSGFGGGVAALRHAAGGTLGGGARAGAPAHARRPRGRRSPDPRPALGARGRVARLLPADAAAPCDGRARVGVGGGSIVYAGVLLRPEARRLGGAGLGGHRAGLGRRARRRTTTTAAAMLGSPDEPVRRRPGPRGWRPPRPSWAWPGPSRRPPGDLLRRLRALRGVHHRLPARREEQRRPDLPGPRGGARRAGAAALEGRAAGATARRWLAARPRRSDAPRRVAREPHGPRGGPERRRARHHRAAARLARPLADAPVGVTGAGRHVRTNSEAFTAVLQPPGGPDVTDGATISSDFHPDDLHPRHQQPVPALLRVHAVVPRPARGRRHARASRARATARAIAARPGRRDGQRCGPATGTGGSRC